MLLIDTFIAFSDISGFGLFSANPIKKGERVWIKTDYDISIDIRLISGEFEKYVLNFGYKIDENTYILCVDNAKYMNHSSSPNLDEIEIEGIAVNVANRDIEANEELTVDYSLFDKDFNKKILL